MIVTSLKKQKKIIAENGSSSKKIIAVPAVAVTLNSNLINSIGGSSIPGCSSIKE